ncbi:phosphatase PAP2 family protein [Caballeronia cordobensis]|uniref:phosphatase PAP2 family protein n=1 Tax=Caballeronia cordobensis TaxID=1353886 RepID=UPI00045F032B|nr:membrane-associated phospholipid phosphatase precursor [Burkholderia sp. RPE67]
MLFSKLLRRLSLTEPEAEDSNRLGWRFVLRRTGIATFFAAVVLVLGGIWLFLGILEDIISEDPLVTVDRVLHDGLRVLRIPVLDHVMVAVSELGDAAVTLPVSLAVLVVLMFRREWRTAGYWIVALATAEASVQLVKFAVQRLRPMSIYDGIENFSFPSSHATMSIVVYGFLTYLLCRGRQREARLRISVMSGSVIALISISRLYLSVHWFSDASLVSVLVRPGLRSYPSPIICETATSRVPPYCRSSCLSLF